MWLGCAGAPTVPASTAAGVLGPPPSSPGLRLPTSVRPTRYALGLELDSSSDRLRGVVRIDLVLDQPTNIVWLHGVGLTIDRATLTDGIEPLEVRVLTSEEDETIGFWVDRPLTTGRARLEVTYTATVPDNEVFGTFRQTEGEDQYIFTQFQASAARRAFPCFDEPSFKARWKLTLRIPENQTAFSNAPVESETIHSGRRTLAFRETQLLPSYLIAWGVGPLEVVNAGTAGKRSTPVRVIVPKGRTAQTRFAQANIGPILERLEAYFGRPYPFEKLDSITIPTFFGAMENAGLITYSQSILLARPEEESVAFQKTFVRFNAHEIAHQWFGNLVTLKWWDDLWLNEAFTGWVSEKIVSAYRPEWNAGVRKVGARERAMRSDALSSAVPVRQPIQNLADAFANGAIVYAKGKTVIGMFERWIGEDDFRDGIRKYIARHAHGNADMDDFLAALSETSSPEVTTAFKSFIEQPGVPLVSMKLQCVRDSKPKLHLAQRRFMSAGQAAPEGQNWNVPLCVRYGRGSDSTRQCFLLTEAEAEMELEDVGGCPTWLVGNEGGLGYYRVGHRSKLLDATLFGAGRTRISTAERVSIIADMVSAVEAGDYPAGEALARARRLLRGPDPHVTGSVASMVRGVSRHLVPDELRGRYERFVRRRFSPRWKALGWRSKPGEGAQLIRLRPNLLRLLTGPGGDAQLRRQSARRARVWFEDESSLPPDLVPAVLAAAARTQDPALYERVLHGVRTTKDVRRRELLVRALPHFTEASMVDRTLELLLDESLDIRVTAPVLLGFGAESSAQGRALGFVKENFEALMDRLPVLFRPFLVYAADQQCTEAEAADAQAFFEERMAKMPGGPRAFETVMDRIRGCIALKAQQKTSVARFLRSVR